MLKTLTTSTDVTKEATPLLVDRRSQIHAQIFLNLLLLLDLPRPVHNLYSYCLYFIFLYY